MSINGTFGNGSEELPLNAAGITAVTAHALHHGLRDMRRGMTEGQDVDEAMPDNPSDMIDLVRGLLSTAEHPPSRPDGRAGQEEAWQQFSAQILPNLIDKVDNALAGTTNTAGIPATVIGAKGDLAERTCVFAEHLQAQRPCVSVSVTGSLRRLFATGNTLAASLSVLVHLPQSPLHAATVTKASALMSNCSYAHRLTEQGEWIQMAGAPLVPDPEPGYVLLPYSLRHLEEALRRAGYSDVQFVAPDEITPAVIEAVLEHAVPAAIHCSGHVLNSAVALVASRHGMAVRLYGPNGKALEPWEASQMICKAATSSHPHLDGLIIARDAVAAMRIGRIVNDDRRDDADLGNWDL
ncbi:hypothetical protein [Streptomyces antibioticus]|uniref:hypothetical protein n=1 Tax=Streptomyces antibioticus TaxID=1890 RepID=UPI00225C36B8|nr:hypothetical protein [Streptomyces antibioticus]MCX4740784.1 hypothetical protein [Streptomyces antibioticus]